MPLQSQFPLFSPGQRIGLFGGSFNPAHAGHRAASLEALKALGLDSVWWLVSPQNPLKNPAETGDFAERLAGAKSASRHARVFTTGLENELGTNITAASLERMRPILARGHFVWIMGADSFASLHCWKRWREVPQTLPLAVLDRPGWTLRAFSSPAARLLWRYRVGECEAASLPLRQPPAWVFLHMPLRAESSTEMRRNNVIKPSRRGS
jgi:nicotinate-nucleotide adenylyltransferase